MDDAQLVLFILNLVVSHLANLILIQVVLAVVVDQVLLLLLLILILLHELLFVCLHIIPSSLVT